jgi:hypothetical protein
MKELVTRELGKLSVRTYRTILRIKIRTYRTMERGELCPGTSLKSLGMNPLM